MHDVFIGLLSLVMIESRATTSCKRSCHLTLLLKKEVARISDYWEPHAVHVLVHQRMKDAIIEAGNPANLCDVVKVGYFCCRFSSHRTP